MKQSTIQGPQGHIAALHNDKADSLPLLFVHADPGSAAQWVPVMTRLANSHTVAAFDFRGAGSSAPAANDDYSYEGRAADVDAVVNALSLTKFVIVSHSAGSAVALAYAAKHGNKVKGIYMVDPVTDPRVRPQKARDEVVSSMEGSQSLEFFTGFVASIAGTNETTRNQVLADAAKIAPAARAGFARAFSTWNPETALAAFKGPIFILSTPATDIPAALYNIKAGIRHDVASDKGHWLQLDHPDLVAGSIEEFLTSF